MAANLTDNLSPEQEAAIVALLDHPTVAKAAEACTVGVRTLHRWLGEPDFSKAYRSARREAFKHAVSHAQKYAPVALNILIQIAADTKAPHSSRVAAAANVLKFGRESLELDDLASRVEALEAAGKPGAAA